jgi:hypothetical protein
MAMSLGSVNLVPDSLAPGSGYDRAAASPGSRRGQGWVADGHLERWPGIIAALPVNALGGTTANRVHAPVIWSRFQWVMRFVDRFDSRHPTIFKNRLSILEMQTPGSRGIARCRTVLPEPLSMYRGAERRSGLLGVASENRRLPAGRESLLRPRDGPAVQAANVAVAKGLKDEHA